MIQFLQYFETTEELESTQALQQAVQEVKTQIPIEAKNKEKWSLFKRLEEEAAEAGIDTQDVDALNAFIQQRKSTLMQEMYRPSQPALVTNYENPYRHIGRNEKITVKYTDGTLKEGVKFKKVEKDLLDGLCELVE